MEFGKNRIQHQQFDWSFYRYPRYDTYFYVGGKDLANFTARVAHQFVGKLEERFDYQLENRIAFLVFNRLSDLKQSNIGLESGGKFNLGGVTKLVGNKVLLHYENSLEAFEMDIRKGIARVMIDEMLFGADFRDKIRSSMFLNIPPWFVEGLVEYIGSNWNTDIDNHLRDAIVEGRFLKFNRVKPEEMAQAGHAIWHYIASVYGEKVIPSIIDILRITRSLDNAFSMILGIDVNELTQEWLNYYDKRYYYQDTLYQKADGRSVIKKNRLPLRFSQPRLSTDGTQLAFVRNDKGKAVVFIYDVKSRKRKRIFKTGFKLQNITDYSFPLLEWHPQGEILSMIDEHKGRIRLHFFNTSNGDYDVKFINNLTKVVDYSYAPDGKKLVFSAMHGGQSDIYVFNNIANTLERITNDIFDDRHPVFFDNGSKILFSSNRDSDSLKPVIPIKSPDFNRGLDLFMYDYERESKLLFRVTNSYGVNEKMALDAGNKHFHYLSDANGIYNIYNAYVDSAIAYIDTIEHYRYFVRSKALSNLGRNILEYSFSKDAAQLAEVSFDHGRFHICFHEQFQAKELPALLPPTHFSKENRLSTKPLMKDKEKSSGTQPSSGNKVRRIVVFGEDKQKEERERIDINNYRFEGEPAPAKDTSGAVPNALNLTKPGRMDDDFRIGKQRIYETAYYSDYLVTQFDRSFINFGYQPFTGTVGYLNPTLNGMFRVGIADLLEDRKIIGAVRLAGILSGNEYLFGYQNFKKRLDKSIFFHRQGFQGQGLGTRRLMVHHLVYQMAYPINEVLRLGGSSLYRNERLVFISSDLQNLQRANTNNHWAIAHAELVFDNAFDIGLNLRTGTRFKLFAEFYKQVDERNTHVSILGFDFRRYEALHRNIIYAGRVAGSTSFGPRKLMYYMGGVDNWFNPRFDNNTAIDLEQNYIFQTIATNMRGFIQNARNGNSFAVINNEVRIPLFQYLIKRPIRSDFLKNFQIVPFNDIGTAFTGSSPYSRDNTFNQQTISSGPITIILENQREPIIWSYGLGLRARVLGYFVRLDYARGVEDGLVQPAVWHFSLSMDF
jgi:WD40 repeat protein